jgi:acyl-CoA hydrolase
METRTIVRPEHLNHQGFLFGGSMLRWVDEFAWIAASLDFPGCTLVTMALSDVVFKHRAASGSILHFVVLPVRQGTTSVTYSVAVTGDEPGATAEKEIFATRVTFVRIDADGRKLPLPRVARPRSGPWTDV